MNTRPQSSDPFDTGFAADDEFLSAAPSRDDAWRQAPVDPAQAFERATAPAAGAAEPFSEFPAPRPREVWDEDDYSPSTSEPVAAGAPPATDDLHGAPSGHPVADLIASANAALGEASVPRITIHAFCARAEMAELVKRAAADRRMERAQTVVRPGGLAAAVEYYQNQPTPSLVIVETLDPAPQLLSYLGRLAEVCDAGTKVVVIGSANDIALYRELMRRGVSEYLVPPLKTLQLISTITSLYADPASPFIGRQIAFCGAKGGSGSSTLAHNVAHAISERMSAGTVLVDMDLAWGTAGLDFNQDPLQGIADALSQPDRLDPVLMDRMMVRCSDHLSLFAAPATLDRDYEISTDIYEEVTQKIRQAAPYVVLDLPHAWSGWIRRVLLSSDDVVIVAEPDLASLRNAKNMVDLVRLARPNDAPPRVVINKAGMPGRPEIPMKDFSEALGVPPAMVIPFDAKLFGQAANNGQMIHEVGPKSKAAEAIDMLANAISRREAGAPAPAAAGAGAGAKSSLLSGLFKRK